MNIGVTGRLGVGKDTFAEKLEQNGFVKISLSDIIRDELEHQGLAVNRSSMNAKGSELRREHGNAVLANRACKRMRTGKNHVLVSIRHPAEVRRFNTLDSFHLVAVKAPRERRLKNLQQRDGMDESELEHFDDQEQSSYQDSWLRTQEVIDMAEHAVVNDSTLPEFQQKIEKLLRSLSK